MQEYGLFYTSHWQSRLLPTMMDDWRGRGNLKIDWSLVYKSDAGCHLVQRPVPEADARDNDYRPLLNLLAISDHSKMPRCQAAKLSMYGMILIYVLVRHVCPIQTPNLHCLIALICLEKSLSLIFCYFLLFGSALALPCIPSLPFLDYGADL